MKKKLVFLFVGIIFLCCSGVSMAETYSWSPIPEDLYDLQHSDAYEWGIQWESIVGNTDLIVGAVISIDNINDWIVEDNDILYFHLLDSPILGVTVCREYVNPESDYFAIAGPLLTTYTDGSSSPEDFEWVFTQDQIKILKEFMSDGIFGFGVDPDCHYFNDGIIFTVETSTPVAEPATMFLLGFGLIGMAAIGRTKIYKSKK